MENKYIEVVEQQLKQGKLFVLAEIKDNSKSPLQGAKIISTYDTTFIVRTLVNKEINKIPKWIRKLFKINTLHPQ